MEIPSTFEGVLLAELNIGIPPASVIKLMKERDDWSFILKLHAIFECALTRLLEKRLGDGAFDERTSFFGKVQQAFQIPTMALDKQFQGFYYALNYVRNRFAHNARYIRADLGTVIDELPRHKRDSVIRDLNLQRLERTLRADLFFSTEAPGMAHRDQEPRAALRRGFRTGMLLMNAMGVLGTLSLSYYIEQGKDGKLYGEDFAPQLQDLLHDPEILELRRMVEETRGMVEGSSEGD
jgi:hypothetical protein